MPDEPLLKLDNVTLTSHAGYNTPEAAMTMYRRAIDLAAAGSTPSLGHATPWCSSYDHERHGAARCPAKKPNLA